MLNLSDHILYEDEDILAINKPAGLVVHPDGRTEEPSVTEWFVSKYPESRSVGEPIILKQESRITNQGINHDSRLIIPDSQVLKRPGVVHRIDRDTSGILLLAKTARGHEVLKKQFQNREIEKVYHLFVYGLVKNDFGIINLPIGKSNSDFRKWSAERGAKGEKREALTYYKVLARNRDLGVTFVEAKPKTGRTHQIRVHFKALHHPVVSDKLYAKGKSGLLGFERLALHAKAIKFKSVNGLEVSLEAPYPEDFSHAIDMLGADVLD